MLELNAEGTHGQVPGHPNRAIAKWAFRDRVIERLVQAAEDPLTPARLLEVQDHDVAHKAARPPWEALGHLGARALYYPEIILGGNASARATEEKHHIQGAVVVDQVPDYKPDHYAKIGGPAVEEAQFDHAA